MAAVSGPTLIINSNCGGRPVLVKFDALFGKKFTPARGSLRRFVFSKVFGLKPTGVSLWSINITGGLIKTAAAQTCRSLRTHFSPCVLECGGAPPLSVARLR